MSMSFTLSSTARKMRSVTLAFKICSPLTHVEPSLGLTVKSNCNTWSQGDGDTSLHRNVLLVACLRGDCERQDLHCCGHHSDHGPRTKESAICSPLLFTLPPPYSLEQYLGSYSSESERTGASTACGFLFHSSDTSAYSSNSFPSGSRIYKLCVTP